MQVLTRLAPALLVSLAATFAAPAGAQGSVDPELDLRLKSLRSIAVLGREGPFHDGINGIAMESTVCNDGTVEVEWFEPMDQRHPTIAFLIASVRDGRIVQISNRSYVKHGFFAANARGCGDCQFPVSTPGTRLGIGCSDTYATDNNGDNYYLGPPDEVDPWLGTWARNCSLFDRGYPGVGAPLDCDGRRSLTRAQSPLLGPVQSRVQVSDLELLIGGKLCYQAHYVARKEADARRENNLGSRTFSAAWSGSRWDLAPTSNLLEGSVLEQWEGASVSSNTNGSADGRVYVGAKVTGPVEGFYRYEYALYNRDNGGAIGRLSLPKCPRARLRNLGFRDIDAEPANDWLSGLRGDLIAFEERGEPLRWNTIFNFWFECDAAPADGLLTLGQSKVRAGAQPEFAVPGPVPALLHSVYIGAGCAFDAPPTLYPIGAPALGTLGNASFGLASSGNQPFQPNLLFLGLQPPVRLAGCTLWIGSGPASLVSSVLANASGVASHALPVPAELALEGKAFSFQAVGRVAAGPLLRRYELSDGLSVRFGNALPDCP